jgi:hypothetical protein
MKKSFHLLGEETHLRRWYELTSDDALRVLIRMAIKLGYGTKDGKPESEPNDVRISMKMDYEPIDLVYLKNAYVLKPKVRAEQTTITLRYPSEKELPKNPNTTNPKTVSLGEQAWSTLQQSPNAVIVNAAQDAMMKAVPEWESSVDNALTEIAGIEQIGGTSKVFTQFWRNPFWQNYGLAKGYYELHAKNAISIVE